MARGHVSGFCACDFEPPDVYGVAQHRARAPYVCDECRGPIGLGDLPEHLRQAAKVIRATAELVRYLADDAAYDGKVDPNGWGERLDDVRKATL